MGGDIFLPKIINFLSPSVFSFTFSPFYFPFRTLLLRCAFFLVCNFLSFHPPPIRKGQNSERLAVGGAFHDRLILATKPPRATKKVSRGYGRLRTFGRICYTSLLGGKARMQVNSKMEIRLPGKSLRAKFLQLASVKLWERQFPEFPSQHLHILEVEAPTSQSCHG